jgi:hypothetical protein
MSIQYLAGAEIDYKDDLEGARFVIRNPERRDHLRLRLELLGLTSRPPGLPEPRARPARYESRGPTPRY